MQHPPLTWLEPGDPFPALSQAWPLNSEAPGLLAAGGSLDVAALVAAYSQGIFPWYSQGQPLLWWSPDPRMVLQTRHFRLHHSLRKTLRHFLARPHCEIRFDSCFDRVIAHCADSARRQQNGTWILPEMAAAYRQLHRAGYAHSVETWVDGSLQGGLYCVGIGRAVFGESMFALQTDASKLALAALVGFCRAQGIEQIDCQQNTRHLAFMGAREMPRSDFVAQVRQASAQAAPSWQFASLYWTHILQTGQTAP